MRMTGHERRAKPNSVAFARFGTAMVLGARRGAALRDVAPRREGLGAAGFLPVRADVTVLAQIGHWRGRRSNASADIIRLAGEVTPRPCNCSAPRTANAMPTISLQVRRAASRTA